MLDTLETDVVVVGSGAAAFMAAIRAASEGASVVMLEKQATFGGTSARSGGAIWIPNNPGIRQAGVVDSPEKAFSYMRSVIPKEQVADEVLKNYIETAPEMLAFLQSATPVRYVPVPGYADYYPEVEGWQSGGRTMDPLPIDGRLLGELLYQLEDTPEQSRAMGRFSMSILEGMQILAVTPGWRKIVMGIIIKYWLDIGGRLKSARDRRLAQGNALIGGMYLAAKRLGVKLELETALKELVVTDGKVTGVIAENPIGEMTIHAKRGVVLAAGGFENNSTLRKAHLPGPTESAWSAGVPGNTGDALQAANKIGAANALMNEAWWAPVVKNGDKSVVLFSEKSKPGLVIVDKKGQRFMNESITYNSYGECMYQAQEKGFDSVPAYMIFDGEYRRKYVFGGMVQSSMSPDWMNKSVFADDGMLVKADSLAELADKLGIDKAGLNASIERFNGFAKTGVDEDFGRGGDDHDRMYGDQEVTPNPCLGKLSKPPFYGAKLYPGDIGTKGGLKIDLDARVLREDGTAIEGLYAAGNCSASIMGDKYPGAGCTLGPGMTMAYRAAIHLMQSK